MKSGLNKKWQRDQLADERGTCCLLSFVYAHTLRICSKIFSASKIDPCVCSVTQLCPALCDPMDCSPPGSCPWNFSGRNTGVVAIFFPQGNLPDPGIEPISHLSPAVEGRFFTTSATWGAPICPIFIYQINAHRGSWVDKILTIHVFVDFNPLLPHLRLKFYLCDLMQESPFSDPCNTCCLSPFPFLSLSLSAFSNPSAIFLSDIETSPAHRGWPWGTGFLLDF